MSSLVRLLQIELELAYIAFNEVTSPDKTSDLLFILVYFAGFYSERALSNGPTKPECCFQRSNWPAAQLWESITLLMVKLVYVCF